MASMSCCPMMMRLALRGESLRLSVEAVGQNWPRRINDGAVCLTPFGHQVCVLIDGSTPRKSAMVEPHRCLDCVVSWSQAPESRQSAAIPAETTRRMRRSSPAFRQWPRSPVRHRNTFAP